MARSVSDLALLLTVISGPDPRVPSALPAYVDEPLDDDSALAGLRVAVSTDLGGTLAVDPAVREVVTAAATSLAGAGAVVAEAYPDLREAEDTFRTLRAWHFQAKLGRLLAKHPELFKQSLTDNIRAGESLSGADVARAYHQRTNLAQRMVSFFQRHDVLLLPTSQVPPFPADQEYPDTVDGRAMATYLDWMRSAYVVTVTGCPAISIPGGFTPEGLPIGVQLVAAHNREYDLLRVAHAFEQLTGYAARRPAV
jgi:amidase